MRKLILLMHVTLDGFIEGEGGDMSWMRPDTDELWDNLFDVLQDVDLFVLGRGMWDDYRNYWKKALAESGFSANEVKYAKLAEKTPHLVFSHTLKDPQWKSATIVNGSVEDEIKKIKEQPGKNIQIVGGARFAASLIDSGLVDEYHLFIDPAIITKGKSFFKLLSHRRSLKLREVRKLNNGVAVLIYQPVSN